MFVKAGAAESASQQQQQGSAEAEKAKEEAAGVVHESMVHSEDPSAADPEHDGQEDAEARDAYRPEAKLQVTALGAYELEDVLGDRHFAGYSACVYLIYKQCFARRRRSSQEDSRSGLADRIACHRLLQAWCLRVDVVAQDAGGEERLLLQHHLPEGVFRLVTPSKLFLPLSSVSEILVKLTRRRGDNG